MKSFLAGILILGVAQNLWAESYSADLFEQGSNKEKKIYTMEVSVAPEGELSQYRAVLRI